MDIFSSFVVALILGLGITYYFLRTYKKEEDSTRLETQLSTYTTSAMLIMVMVYTDDIALLAMLLIICLPITIYGFYKQYQTDKKRLIYSTALLAGIMAVVWSTALF